MKRRLFNLAAALSLLLCLATIALWVRGYWINDMVVIAQQESSLTFVQSGGGAVRFGQMTGGSSRAHLTGRPSPGYRRFFADPFDVHMSERPSRYYVSVAHYVVIALLAVPGVIWLRKRRPMISPNRCSLCGYDLRATPDRCPECGAVPAENAA